MTSGCACAQKARQPAGRSPPYPPSGRPRPAACAPLPRTPTPSIVWPESAATDRRSSERRKRSWPRGDAERAAVW
eukprot:5044677-Prymnesium_polylepis.1